MRLIKGKSLTSLLTENGGTINAALLKKLLPSALITLDQIHKYGIIHRDISPGNFIVTEDETLYLIDFGAASEIKQLGLKNNLIINHKGLDSPESNRPFEQGPWTDIYSLCATILYLLTGEGTPLAKDRIVYDVIPQTMLKTTLPTKMQNALLKGLNIDRNKRYQSVMDLEKELFGKTVNANNQNEALYESFSVHYHAKTDIGTRTINQDNFMVDTLFSYAGEDCEIKGYIDCSIGEFHAVAVADGVATSSYGEIASKAAIQAVAHFIDYFKYSELLPQHLLEEFLNQLNEKIVALGKKIGKTASTISIFLWKNNEYYVVNIGDSPIYKLSKNNLKCLTTAHTLANSKKNKGEAINLRDFHTLTSYLGRESACGYDMAAIDSGIINKGDIFLICSDGISDALTENAMKRYLKKDGDKTIKAIYNYAHKRNNMDNSTAIILKF